MSWLTAVAGHAESILNKIDQNAANVLQIPSQNEIKSMEAETVNEKAQILINEIKTKASSSPMKLKIIDGSAKKSSEQSSSSRRSSFSSSRQEGTVIEKQLNGDNSTTTKSLNIDNQPLTAEKELAALKIMLIEIKSERDELKTEVENLMEHFKTSRNFQIEQNEIKQLMYKLENEREELQEKIKGLEDSNFKYIKSISELEINISKLHHNETELLRRIDFLIDEKEQSVSELQKYRQRAQNTLQIKEKLITELKNNNAISPSSSILNNQPDTIEDKENDLEFLRNENELQKNQIKNLNLNYEKLKLNNQQIIDETNEKIIKLTENYNRNYENLKIEQSKNLQMINDLKIKQQEINSVNEEIVRLRSNISNKIYEKDLEINQLKEQILANKEYNEKKNNLNALNTNSNALETRLQSLTQSLVQKQGSLESLTAEKNALRLQLEKLENQHKTTIMQIRSQRPQILNMNVTDDAKAQVPNFLQENPFDTSVARRVKRAYSSLDSVSVRLGVFLRRFPLVRIFVIIYMVLLHLWVMVVLLSSTPT